MPVTLAQTNIISQCTKSDLASAMQAVIVDVLGYEADSVSIDYARPQAFSDNVFELTGKSALGIAWLYTPEYRHGTPLPLTSDALLILAEYQNKNNGG